MLIKYKIALCISLVLFVTLPIHAITDTEIETIIGRMTIDEKIGQLLIFGIGGRNVGPLAEGHIIKRHAGGLLLFERNIKDPIQLANLTTDLQLLAQDTPNGIPLFIATDQEGGKVTRLKKGATVLPGNLALGATGSVKLAEKAGELTGIELASVGININFAPVLDVNTNPKNPVIGVRSFGESPELVSKLGIAYIRGMQRQGVLATAKHFPGHGDTLLDSHKKLPILRKTKKQIDSVELAPFRAAIKSGVAAIMSAHILYTKFDKEKPATLSFPILTELLRLELGFKGLIITDDLEMNAIDSLYETGNAAVLAIQAGADMILIPGTFKKQQRVYNALRQAVKLRKLSESRINESVRRILKSKNACGAFEKPIVHIENPNAINSPLANVGSRKHREIAETIAARAITMVKNTNGVVPMNPDSKKPVLLLSPSRLFSNTFLKAHEDITHINPIYIPAKVNAETLVPTLLINKPSVIVAGITNLQQANLIQLLSKKTDVPVIVVSLSSPYLLGKCPDVDCAIVAYDGNYNSIVAFMDVLLGKQQATGKLPVTIP